MIIGTAGHIDHGKTSLVRALTGVDTDRLKEEKARGITIELGYAYLPDEAGQDVLGFIDVPGHEKFVHTMAAGAVGVDHALLVVAADDGVMPQTREHLAILDLLGVRGGTVALTKVDRVEPSRIAEVRQAVQALLAGTPLADAACFETAATRPGDPGVQALLAHLRLQAAQAPHRAADGPFRLAVDRVFTLAGQGTVVTGTVLSGQITVGEVVRHSHSGRDLRVRSLHAQNRPAVQGHAGQRCALNLAGIEREALARGHWVAAAEALHPSDRLDVRLRLLPDAAPLGPWTPVHVHLGTAHQVAHAAPLDGETLAPGQSGRVQLVLSSPVWALPGDRLIVRNAQASRTVGGGTVIDPFAPERRRRSAARRAWLEALEAAQAGGPVAALLRLAPAGLPQSRLVHWLGRRPDVASAGPDLLVLDEGGGDPLWLATPVWDAAQAQVLDLLARFHERHPDEPGVNAARLRRMAQPGVPAPGADRFWAALIETLREQGHLARSGAWLHLPSHRLQLDAAEQALAERLLPWIEDGAYDPPWVRDLATRAGAPEDLVRQLLRKLARQGRLFQVIKDLFYTPCRIQTLSELLAELASRAPRGEVEARAFRDGCGLGRKRAIQLLEWFDRVGYTRRVRDAHVLRGAPGWPQAL